MSLQKVRNYFHKWGIDGRILELPASSATVLLAAQALSVIPARIAKTLSFHCEEGCLLIVAAGDVKIDNAKFKSRFGLKAKMLSPDDALQFTGHAVGGVCPFAVSNPQVKIYLDKSLQRFETVFPACGSSSSAIELSCAELEKYADSQGWIDVCHPIS